MWNRVERSPAAAGCKEEGINRRTRFKVAPMQRSRGFSVGFHSSRKIKLNRQMTKNAMYMKIHREIENKPYTYFSLIHTIGINTNLMQIRQGRFFMARPAMVF